MSAKRKFRIPIVPLLFIVIPAIVILIAGVKFYTTSFSPSYVYVKVKLSQGLWWASTESPDIWLATGIKSGDKEYNLLGKPTADILSVRYYPTSSGSDPTKDKYGVFLTVKLAASYNARNQKYTYNRSAVLVGAPIDIETQRTSISGTVTALSSQPFDDKYIEKTVFLTKRFAYPWEYDAIKIGDAYFDGQDTVFKVLDKQRTATAMIVPDYFGNYLSTTVDSTRYIIVKATIKVREENGVLYFGDEKLLTSGASLEIVTPNFNYKDFVVGEIY